MKPSVDTIVSELLNKKLAELEKHFDADILVYYGAFEGSENQFLSIIEDLANDDDKKDTLYIVLTTGGGSATVVERFVNIIRKHYAEVNFIVPDYAYSAGTIFCIYDIHDHLKYLVLLLSALHQQERKLIYADQVSGLRQS